MTLQQLHQKLVLDPLMAQEMAKPRQLKSYESSKAQARQKQKRSMLGSLHVLSGCVNSCLHAQLDSMSDMETLSCIAMHNLLYASILQAALA